MSVTTVFSDVDELRNQVGHHLGFSEWTAVEQERIQLFADATGDQQWIHVDPERAKAESPFGTAIAHGYLTLSLIPFLAPQIYRVEHVKMSVNYGSDKVRFPNPVPSGSQVRLGAQLQSVDHVGDDTYQVKMAFSVEVEGKAKPACVAEVLFRYTFFPSPSP
jgi:acyl dehydratase